jgi:hypothetical protein
MVPINENRQTLEPQSKPSTNHASIMAAQLKSTNAGTHGRYGPSPSNAAGCGRQIELDVELDDGPGTLDSNNSDRSLSLVSWLLMGVALARAY